MHTEQHKPLSLPARIYRNFDADYALEVPGEGFGGWTTVPVELPLAETALVSMHAWDCGTREDSPAAWRGQEYYARAKPMLENVFPPLLAAARGARMTVLHVVGGGDYYRSMPGYLKAVEMAGTEPEFVGEAPHSDANIRFRELRANLGTPGARNRKESRRLDFAVQARPIPGEGIAENAAQLSALCRAAGVSHLVYIGFAINWCLLTSPGGIRDMYRRWYFCSVIGDATTALENRETARAESNKAEALWRISTGYGFVFDSREFIGALKSAGS